MSKPRSFFDVIAIHAGAEDIQIVTTDKSEEHAEAIIERLLMQAMSSDVIYKVVPAGSVAGEDRFAQRRRSQR